MSVGSFLLDFVHGEENAVASAARLPFQLSADINNAAANLGNRLGGGQDQTIQQNLKGPVSEWLVNQSQATGTIRQLLGDVAQTGLMAAAPGIGGEAAEAASPLIDAATNVGGKVVGGLVKGGVEGAAINAPQSVAQGIASNQKATPKNFALDFLQGAGTGAALGGVIGGAESALKSSIQPAFAAGKMSDNFSDDDLQKMAQTDNPKTAENILKPVTGPVVAKELSPTIASDVSRDPNIIKNMIDQNIENKLPSPAPTPLPPPTPVSDINTPTQVAGQYAEMKNEEPSFINSPDEEMPQTSHVTKVSALEGMNNILKTGTVDEALSHYMNATNSTYGDAQEAFAKLRGQNPEDLNQGNINQVLNPRFEEGSNLVNAPVQAGDNASIMNKTRMSYQAVMREGAKAIVQVRKLDPHDLQLMDAARDKTPEQVANAAASTAHDSAQFLKAWQATTNYDNLAQGIGSGGLGQDVAFRQNHLLTRYTEQGEPTGQPVSSKGSAQQPLRPGYAQGRVGGGNPRFDNFLQDLEHDVQVKSNNIGQLTFSKSLGEAYPDQVAQGNLPAGYKQVNLPFAKGVSLPQNIADELNKRAPVTTTGALKGYDTVNSAIKNLKLGGGLFHALNVMGSFVGQQLSSGKAFTNPSAIGDVVKATFSDKAVQTQMSQLDKVGMLRAADRLGLEYNKFGVSADVGAESNRVNDLPFLKQIHESIFGRQIPMMKVLTLQQKLEQNGIDPKNMSDEDIQTGTKLAKELNQNYGGMNRMIQGLNPSQFRTVSRFMLATDYTEGQLRTLVDAFTKGGADGRLAREVVAGKALLFGGIATAAGAAGGEFKGMSPKQVAEDIAMKAINPSFQFGSNTIGLPETQLSEFTKPIASSVKNAREGANAVNPFKDFASARLAGVPALGEEWLSNRTYSGNALRGTDYYGRPISGGQTAANVASSLLPIPIANTAETATGQQSLGAAIGNTAGLNVKPTYSASYAPLAGQTYISELEKTPGVSKAKIDQTTEFFDLLEQNARNKTKVTTAATKAIVAGNTQKANEIVQSYDQKLIAALQPWVKKGGTQYLDQNMLQLLQTAELTYGKVAENVNYNVKTNPTAYGAPIQALASTPNQ